MAMEDLIDDGLTTEVVELGQRLAAHTRLLELAWDFETAAHALFGATQVTLWVHERRDAPPYPIGQPVTGERPGMVIPLLAGGCEVGRVELTGAMTCSRELKLVIPYLALGVAGCLVQRGQRAIDAGASASLVLPSNDRWSLTPRESRVLELLTSGLSNKQIASILTCSVKNVEAALSRVMHKAEVRSRTELVCAHLRRTPPADAGRPHDAG
jgi:DNA-binding CsgD family transcriptional regulator